MSRVKIISRALAFVMAMQLLGDGAIVFAEENYIGEVSGQQGVISNETKVTPFMKNVTVNKNQLKPGELLEIYGEVEGDISQVENCIAEVYLEGELINVKMIYNASNNKFEGSLNITEEMKYRSLYISNIGILNKEGNYINWWNNSGSISDIRISDANGNFDVMEPKLQSFALDRNEASVGETVKATIKCSDDLSGIRNVSLNINLSDQYCETVEAQNINGEYIADINIKEEYEGKNVRVSGISITDKSGNNLYVSDEDLKNNYIYVRNKDGQVDKTPPVINSVNFNKSQVKVGESLTLEIDASDDISSRFSGSMWINIGGLGNREELKYNENTRKLEFEISITEDMKYKKITVNNIEIYDESGNKATKVYNWDEYPTVIITDLNGQVDNTAPVYNSLNLSSNRLSVGDTLIVGINATDDLSGIRGLILEYYIGDLWSSNHGGEYNSQTGRYEFKINITEDMKYKKIRFTGVGINDNAGNNTQYEFTEEDNNVAYVVGEDGVIDTNPPIINSVTYSHEETIGIGEVLKVTVNASDAETSVMGATLNYQIGNEWISGVEATYNSNTGNYEFNIAIKPEDVYKNIRINTIRVKDMADNYAERYDNIMLSVKDSDGVTDTIDPVYSGGSFDKSIYSVGDTITLSVEVSDALSGVNRVSAYILKGVEGIFAEFELNKSTGKYEYKIIVDNDMIYNKIEIQNLNIYDNAGNSKYINDSDININPVYIQDTNGTIDTVAPVLSGFESDKETVKVGETVTYSVRASDNLSGIAQVEVDYSIAGTNIWRTERLAYDPITEKYEFTLNITKDMLYKKIVINNISITDVAGNRNIVDKENITLKDVVVVDESGIVDTDPPIINNVTYSHEETIGVGEVLKVTVSASDAETAVNGATLSYQIGNEWISEEDATYNSSTGNYEFNIAIKPEDIYKNISINTIRVKDMADNYAERYDNIRLSVKDSGGNTDTTFPVYLGGGFDKSIYSVGDTITLSVEASDDLSGVSRVSTCILKGVECIFPELVLNKSTGKYEYKIKVDNGMIYNKVVVENINIFDNAGNSKHINNSDININPVYIQDQNGNIDTVAPLLLGFESDKEIVKVGETVTYSVRASDDLSGIAQVEVGYRIAGTDIWRTERLAYNPITEKYEFALNITKDMLYKKIVINNISITDVAGNRNIVDKENITLKDVVVVDESGIVDSEAPVFKNVSFSNTVVKPEEKLVVYVEATDRGLGIDKVNIDINTPTSYEYKEMNYDENLDKYFVEIDILEEWIYKKISISGLLIVDKAGNETREYSHELQKNTVNVADKNGLYDDKAPILDSISLDKEYVTPGSTLKVSAKVTDEVSGVEAVNYSYRIGEKSDYLNLSYNSNTGLYEGLINVSKEDKYKKIISNSVYVGDKAGNFENYYNIGNITANITDENGDYDIQAPKVYDVKFNKEYVKPGESVKLQVKAVDDKSGIKNINVSYYLSGEYEYDSMVYNATTKMYELEIKTDTSMNDKYIRVDSISTEDFSENYSYVHYISKYISISNTLVAVDEEAPKFVNGLVSKSTAKVGDKIKVSVEAADNASGIGYMTAYYGPFQYMFGYEEDCMVDLKYNSITKKFEGELIIREYMQGAKLYVDSLYIVDKAGNSTDIRDERLDSMNILVPDTNGQIDTTPPILEDFYLSKNEAEVGEKVKVYFKIKDDNPLREVKLFYADEFCDEEITLSLNKTSGLYEGEVEIKPYMENTMIIANYFSIMDKGGNSIVPMHFEDTGLSKLNIKVADANGQFDRTAPGVKSYGVIDYNYSKYIELVYEEIGSGIRYANIVYETESGEKHTLGLDKNRKEGSLLLDTSYVSTDYKHEKLTAKEILIVDIAGNETVYNSKDKDLTSLDIVGKDYVKYNKGDVTFNAPNNESKEIVGKTIYKNHIVRLVLENSIVDEVKSDANGNFKFNLDYYWQGYNIMIEVIDPVTKKCVAYEKKEVARNVDFDKNGKVDILDLAVVSSQYGKTHRNYGFEERLDINGDEIIDLFDLVYVSRLID